MIETRIIMGMPVTIEIVDARATQAILEKVFAYFTYVDETFSTYKKESEISRINRGEIAESDYSSDIKTVFELSEKTKKETDGYFDIFNNGICDPSGIVKGWAIHNAADILRKEGFENFYVDAGGDIEISGKNQEGKPWKIGIENPFNKNEVIKVLHLADKGIATSGTYIRGDHIYNPKGDISDEIASLSVIGPNAYEADRFATAAFAMGRKGIEFIQKLAGFEAYMIGKNGVAVMTSGFEEYTKGDDEKS